MVSLVLILSSLITFSFNAAVQDIESAFLQNDARLLFAHFPENHLITISIPEPISFSDSLSSHQAYFLFQEVFSDYSTYQFFSDRYTFQIRDSRIIRARWSFRDKKKDLQYVYQIFFYIVPSRPGIAGRHSGWMITEIRVEKS